MISQKGEPALARLKVPGRSLHPTRDRSFGNIKAEHEKLAANFGLWFAKIENWSKLVGFRRM